MYLFQSKFRHRRSRNVASTIIVCFFSTLLTVCVSTPEKPKAEAATGTEQPQPRKTLADVYRGSEDAGEALKLLEQNDIDPQDVETRLVYAALLYSQNRIADARMELESLVKEHPSTAKAWFYLSLVENVNGNAEDRDKALDTAISADPDLVEALIFRGDIASAKTNWAGAEADYKHAMELNAEIVEPLVGLAWVYAKNDNLKDSLSLLDKAVAMAPEYAYALVDRSRVLISLGEYAKAEKDLGKAIELEPDVPWHYLDRARIRLQYFENYEGALFDLGNVERLDKNNFFAVVYLAGLHETERRFVLSESYYKKTLEMRPDYVWAYMPLGKFAWMRGNYIEAAKWFAKTAEEDPDFSYQLMRALSLLRAGRTKEADVELQETLRQLKQEKTAYEVVRFCIERNNDFFAVNALNKEKNKKLRERLWYYMGLMYELEGNDAGARVVYERIGPLKNAMEFDLAWAAIHGMGE